MLIEELDRQTCLNLLFRTRRGRLACSQGTQPYIVPFHFACDTKYIYGFSTVGKKIEWMRVNPLVCVESDAVINSQNWMSVVVQGRYEELPDTPEWSMERDIAHCLLQQEPMWWEPAYAKKAIDEGACSLEPVFYRIHIDKITGRRATPEPSFGARLSAIHSGEDGWLQKFLRRLHEIA